MMPFFTRCIERIIIYFSFLIFLFHFPATGNVLETYESVSGKTFISSSLLLNDTTPSVYSSGYYVSNNGINVNNGTSESTPRLNIDSIEAMVNNAAASGGEVFLNLEANSQFREQFDPYVNGINVNSYNQTINKHKVKLTGLDVVTKWSPTPGFTNVYNHLLYHAIDLQSPDYTYIMVAEIDTLLEKTHPISAVRYLPLVSNLENCGKFPGSYFTPAVSTNPTTVYIHPTNGSPGNSKYRYEVTTRNFTINGFYVNGSTYKNLFLQSSAYGYGMLSAGDNSYVKNVLFQGGGTHHIVIKSGELDSTIFLPGPIGLKDRIAAVFYKAEGENSSNKITNSIFLDIPNAIYSHTNGTANYKAFTIDKVFAFGNKQDASVAFSGSDIDSITVVNSYTENYQTGWSGSAQKMFIINSIFNNTNQSAILIGNAKNLRQNTVINNVLIKTNGNDNNQVLANYWTSFGVRAPYQNSDVDVSNLIFHGYSTWNQAGTAIWTFQVGGQLRAHKNIYICDVNDNSLMNIARVNNSGGLGKAANIKSDSNVYIIVRGGGFHWYVEPYSNNDINVYTLEQFQTLTGQDKNSLLIDLRKNPLGLKAIFADPENGNWALTSSPQAVAIKNLRAGMTTPPFYYPQRPSYDNAISYKSPEGFSALDGTLLTDEESVLRWHTYNEWQVASFEVEYSNDSISFSSAGQVIANGNVKDNSYEFKHSLPEVPLHYYRLKIVNKDNSTRYSNVVSLKLILSNNEDILFYPNPVKNAVTVKYPRRDKSSLSIYDFSGKLINHQNLNPQSSRTTLYLDHLPNGMYIIKWNSNKEQSLKPFFKHH